MARERARMWAGTNLNSPSGKYTKRKTTEKTKAVMKTQMIMLQDVLFEETRFNRNHKSVVKKEND